MEATLALDLFQRSMSLEQGGLKTDYWPFHVHGIHAEPHLL